MIKNIIEANNNVTVGAKEIEILKELFPACFRNGSFDIERLKEYLKDKIHVTEEGYELRFLGKNYARMLASLDTTTVIVPDAEHNNLPENKDSKNIYISGDNLDALKHLLKSYAGSIKCIYIDPPYNTGSDDFVYTDSFNFTVEELTSKLSISEEQASRVLDLTRRGSATHSAWLMFMLPRLLLARDLLSKDGVIFISIDENEHANLRLLCEEIFGEENSAGEIVWKNSSKNDEAYISMQHEYILCFVKSKTFNIGDWHEAKEGVQEIFAAFAGFRKKYGTDWKAIHAAALDWYKQFKASDPISDSSHYSWMDEKGVYFPDNIAGPNFGQYVYDVIHPITGKVCKAPASGWRFPEETMKEKIADGLIHFGEDETTVPNKKTYLKDTLNQSLTSIKYRDGRVASKRLTSLLGANVFTNPKDPELLCRLFNAIGLQDGDIVLDFFSGSGTTGEAVQNLIADNKNLSFILVQIKEDLDNTLKRATGGGKAVAKNAIDFCDMLGRSHTLDNIAIERLKRIRQHHQQQNPMFHEDLGFKHFTLREPTNQSIEKMARFDPHSIFGDNTLVDEFGVPTILTTWLVRDGYGLTSDVKTLNIEGYEFYYMDKHLYIINPNLSNEVVASLLDRYQSDAGFNPQNIVIYGYALSWGELQGLKDSLQVIRDGEKNMRINFDVRY